MKVIVAGFCKTGTKTIAAALRHFGYTVYDYEEQVFIIGDEWKKMLRSGGTLEDFRRMFDGVDATIDVPACYFWEELHEAFPDAKIIFMQRETEDVWLSSMKSQIAAASHHWILAHLFSISPTKNKVHSLGELICKTIYGSALYNPWPFNYVVNETLLKKVYRSHNAHVLHKAPKEKLLIFDVRDGWAPLCKFLGEDVPNIDFPHENIRGDVIDRMLESSPMIQRMKKEVMISLTIIGAGAGLLTYYYFS